MPAKDLTIKRSDGIAGQVRYNVTRQAGHGVHRSAFVGSVYGSPGPVVCVLMSGVQFFVDNPERFGTIFNRDWIRNFYTD